MVARVCLVSGGTGGHLMPALVLARALRERGHEPLLVTEGRDVEKEFLQRQTGGIDAFDLPGRPSLLALPSWLLRSTLRARTLLRERDVHCVVSTGGRPSLPVGLACRSLGKPLFLLEQNAVAGRANRWLKPFAARMYLGLPGPGLDSPRVLFTGTPLRPELYCLDKARSRAELGLRSDHPVVLVTGGSQGASSLNAMAPVALTALARPVQVLHLSGLGADEDVRRRYAVVRDSHAVATVRPVAMDMDRMLGAADLVICRGGGTTVAELMAVGRPSIIVPYPHHKDRQQMRNAMVLQQKGAAIVIEESALTAEHLQAVVAALLDDPARLLAMGQAALALAAVDPTAKILADMQSQGGL
ncbi:MAG: UDP-N-acetylglucosamine--N-acetylmuramyl-(pentapeptide) pyrophosphoryl-undecaprenol N-acetylglucosamine transferase [Planctomycetes bacterium]|nr:UDP-N-acetylglucosamine--N-acetylmuramyl-(pentapeptide) pyrophosphoryl-undecaprenol N-acetylglucosamine transferase [Planctomycetota bacterium]